MLFCMICYLCCISHLLPYTHHVLIQISTTLLDVFLCYMMCKQYFPFYIISCVFMVTRCIVDIFIVVYLWLQDVLLTYLQLCVSMVTGCVVDIFTGKQYFPFYVISCVSTVTRCVVDIFIVVYPWLQDVLLTYLEVNSICIFTIQYYLFKQFVQSYFLLNI